MTNKAFVEELRNAKMPETKLERWMKAILYMAAITFACYGLEVFLEGFWPFWELD